MMKQQKCCNEIQNRAEQITITMRKSNIAYVNLIIPCKDPLQIDDYRDIFSYSYN